MTDKSQAKYAQLWAAYVQARALRHDCLSRELPATADAFAALDLKAEDSLVEMHLEALSAERKALKRLAKYARKHGSDVLPATSGAATPEPAAPEPNAAAKAPRRKPASAAAPAAKAAKASPRAKARAAAKPAPAELPAASPARPRRPRAVAKGGGPRGAASTKA